MAFQAIISARRFALWVGKARSAKERKRARRFLAQAGTVWATIGLGLATAPLMAISTDSRVTSERGELGWWCALVGAAALGAALAAIIVGNRAQKSRERELAEVTKAHEKAILDVLEPLPIECWAMDMAGNYTLLNGPLRAYWRLPARPVLSQKEEIPVPEDLVARWHDCNRRALGGEIVRDEFKHERDGIVRHYFRFISPLRSGRRVTGIMGVHLDITDRVESEKAWHATERRLTHYFRQNPSAMIEWDAQAVVTRWNPAAEVVFEYKAAEAKGKTAVELIVPSDEHDQFSELWRAILEGKEMRCSGRNRRKGGGMVTCEWLHSPIKDRNERVVAVASFAFDISARVVLEERLRHAAQLESMGRLAAGVAHELNNVLAPMLIEVDRLARGELSRFQVAEHLERLRVSIDQAQELTERTLTVAGKTGDAPEWLSLSETTRSTLGELSARFDRRVELVFNTDSPLPSLRVERSALVQIVTHLALNAYDAVMMKLAAPFEEEWRPRLIFFTGVVERDRVIDGNSIRKRYQLLAVTDNGSGIEPDQQSKLFEPFFTTKTAGSGRGLGLAAVWRLAESQGGWVELDSASGRGSTFWVFIPETPNDVALLPSASVWLASEDEETRRFRVLLVEDNLLVAEAIASLLNDAGHQVTTAPDAEEGWVLLQPQGESFDLVISDLNLPGMSGGELLEKMVEHHLSLPVLLITGYCEAEEVAALMKLGAKALLKKPVQPRELLDFIAYYAREGPAKATGAHP